MSGKRLRVQVSDERKLIFPLACLPKASYIRQAFGHGGEKRGLTKFNSLIESPPCDQNMPGGRLKIDLDRQCWKG